MIDLEKILELESKATSGPWHHAQKSENLCEVSNGESSLAICAIWSWGIPGELQMNKKNSELIVEMRNNIKQICLELQAAREVINSARFVLARHDSGS